MSAPHYEHDSFEPIEGGVRLRGRTVLVEDRAVQAYVTEDGRAVRLEGGYATMPPEAARALAAGLIAAADRVENTPPGSWMGA